jgi:hypothetical protein
MTNKQWAVANLTGKVLNRAMRAIEEQPQWEDKEDCYDIGYAFEWGKAKEGYQYWSAVHNDHSNPDQYLPTDYVEAPEYVGEMEAKDEFLEWLEVEINLRCLYMGEVYDMLEEVMMKYKQLKK